MDRAPVPPHVTPATALNIHAIKCGGEVWETETYWFLGSLVMECQCQTCGQYFQIPRDQWGE